MDYLVQLFENGREAYLAWLHQTYIPAMLKRPGYLCAAHYASIEDGPKIPRRTNGKKITTTDPDVAHGDRYILLFGAEHSNILDDPTPSEMLSRCRPKAKRCWQ